ncbi:MAG: type II toxin-antitoxin system RelE/ParE family toxin [Proteobacteria bacterium]|nr:type II toxin-antitoxin system RelE/ParE family toxin [Pseudomonadota bacterium]
MADASLLEAVMALEAGSYDADLGAGVYKQRIARPGEGLSGGYRVILCFQAGSRTFFVYGFSKAGKANITAGEKKEFKKLAKILFAIPADRLAAMLQHGDLDEIIPRE